MSHLANEVTPECLLLAATAVNHSLHNRAGGSFLCMEFEANMYKGMQNMILDTYIWDSVGI